MRCRRAAKVALTVDATDDKLANIVEALRPDLLQLHGRETPERVVAVKARFGRPVMKALPVERREDLAAVYPYAGIADRILFDAVSRACSKTLTPSSPSCSQAASTPPMSPTRLR